MEALRTERDTARLSAIVPVERSERLPLSFAQQRLWFLAQMDGVSEAYHVHLRMRYAGELNATALRSSLNTILRRHEALRTTFVLVDGEPVQRIAPAEQSVFCLIEHDLRQHHDAGAELDRLVAEEVAPFDLEAGPLIRGRLIRVEEQDHVLLITMHHIVSDGWSMGILNNELNALYTALLHGDDDPLPALKLQYADYAVWQRKWIEGEVLQQQAAYWKETLAGAPALLELPTDHVRPAQQVFAGAFARLVLDEKLTAGLKELSRRHGATLYMTLLAAWAALMARLSGQQDIVIGSPAANRGRTEVEGLIGFFANTLALRIDLSGSPTVGQLLARVKTQALAAQQHQDIPFQQVVEIMRPTRSLSHSTLFQATFAWQNNDEGTLALPGLEKKPLHAAAPISAKFDMNLFLQPAAGGISGGIAYATSLFEPATIERYVGYFRNLLEAMVADDAQTVDRLPMLGAEERNRMLYEWNATETAFPVDKCIHQLFEQEVSKTPQATAVVFEGSELSYDQLNRRANQLAHYLRQIGVTPDERVAICLTGLEAIVGILGILKAGGVYVALDSTYTEQFLNQVVEEAEITVAIIHSSISGCFSPDVRRVICIDSEWQHIARSNDDDLNLEVRPEDSAYIIFTSGSTGVRKGVIVSHQGVCNVIHWMEREFRLVSSDVVTQKSSFCFDNSVWETFLPLCKGARLIMASPDIYMDTEAMVRLIVDHRVTITHFVPVMLAMFLDHLRISKLTSLRKVLCGCDVIPVVLVESFFERFPPESNTKIDLINFYGPTENTIGTHAWTCLSDYGGGTVPIGRPISNTRTYILDGCGEPVPVGVTGELYIGGAGVARGYLNRPELTAERFLKDPFVQDPRARMYRTGDLGRYLADGNIEFLGRNDFQVKIRGFRVEPGEIEARLAEHPGVRDAVVIAREDVTGDKRLVAYYIPASEQEAPDAEALRSHISAVLPDYMVPAAYVQLQSFPLTPNGKLDRKALPAPGAAAHATRSYEAPLGETETMLAAVWSDLLGIDRIGRYDNFFELGGHSLLAVRVISQLRSALGVEIPLSDIFTYPALKDLALNIRNASAARLSAIVPVERSERLPLSFAQQRLWFLAQMDGVSEAYHVHLRMRYAGELNATALRSSLNTILRRHEALRTTFVLVDGEPVQRIAPAEQSVFCLIEHDLRQHHDAGAELDRLVAEEVAPFDLEAGPLIRGRLIRVEEQDHVLLITMHHIVSDGWSMGILNNELNALYTALLHGDDDPLPALKLQYADYAVWQRKWIEGEVLQQQAAYWKETLAGAPALLELPTDHVRPAQQVFAGAFARLVLDEKLTAGLKELSRRHGATLYMTLLAAWAALMARLSGQQDIVIGSPAANRGRTEVEGLIGFFVNTLALRLDLSDSPTVGQLIERAKTQALAAQQHQDIPFEQVVELLNPVRSLAHPPLFQVMFAWQNAPQGLLELAGLELLPVPSSPYSVAKFDLSLFLQELGNRIAGGVEYATSLFNPATVERYLGYFRTLLEGMAADETQSVDRLPILSQSERHRVVYEWNDTKTEFPSDKCIHELFEEQVEKTPDAVAVVYEEQSLSYAELNARANRLAHYLRELGVRPDDRVAICVERGFEMIVALLAVLKAGGAYVPLDPAYPPERLGFMLEDSAPVALLTQNHLVDLFKDLNKGLPVLVLTEDSAWEDQSESNPDPAAIGLTLSHLAYVIYTSGSTGTPKGVMVQHANVARLFMATEDWFHFGACDVWTLFHSYAFDFSVWEIWGALLYGGRLIVVPDDIVRSPEDFYSLICQTGVTVLNQTPTAFRQLIAAQAGSKESHQLRTVIFGGEALEVSTLKPWYRQNGELQTQLINMYGITETTVHVTYRALEPIDTKYSGSPIGLRLPDLRIYILDPHGEAVPVGVEGELYIGGAGVARGYLNRAELTAEKFLKDPFVDEAGARMYRTGDLGRYLADGNIEFLGRNDFQVKIRGFRVELGEIEARLLEHDGVREAVVLAREDTPGDKRLAAYYTAGEKDSVDAEQLRSHLSAVLPEYMVPAAYVRLDSLPLTANGKLDRKALAAPESGAYAVRGYESPQGEVETKLAEIWAEVLGLDRVGRRDNFFELGGNSLLAVRVVALLRQAQGVEVSIRSLFSYPVLADLAVVQESAPKAELPPITRLRRKGDANVCLT